RQGGRPTQARGTSGYAAPPGAPAEPASTVAVPVRPDKHCATPLPLTVATEAMFPLQTPLLVPMHQARLCNGTGFVEPPYVPNAANWTCPFGKSWASAIAGVRVMELK